MAFRKLNHLKSYFMGSLVSDTGSEYLFGYDEVDGLKWLERTGVEYTPADSEWREAEQFIASATSRPSAPPTMEIPTETTALRPKTVTRSVAGYEMGTPEEPVAYQPTLEMDDNLDDDAIAEQASAWLRGLGD